MIDELYDQVNLLRDVIRHVPSRNVNTEDDKQIVIHSATLYFKSYRPHVLILGFDREFIEKYETLWHSLIRLAHGNNAKQTYVQLITSLWQMTIDISVRSKTFISSESSKNYSSEEQVLIDTLEKLIPTSADSYKQGLLDLHQKEDRLSYRGVAAEFREVLREILDYLSPDSNVMSQPGYKNDVGQTKPTMKQKVRYILKSRQRSKSQMTSTEKSIELIEELYATITRAVYDRASLSTHVITTGSEVRQIKRYLDTVLFDLLEVK